MLETIVIKQSKHEAERDSIMLAYLNSSEKKMPQEAAEKLHHLRELIREEEKIAHEERMKAIKSKR